MSEVRIYMPKNGTTWPEEHPYVANAKGLWFYGEDNVAIELNLRGAYYWCKLCKGDVHPNEQALIESGDFDLVGEL